MAQVNIDIGTRVVQRDLNRVGDDIQRKIAETAGTAGQKFGPEFERSVRIDGDKLVPSAASFADNGARAGRAYAQGFKRAADVSGLDRNLTTITRSMDSMAQAAGSFAMAGLAPALVGVAGAAATAVGALALLPAVIGAAGAGVGTLVIGLHGFGDAMKDMGDPKKFAADLQSLAPSAQQAALEIQHLVDGPLGALKKATQEALFADVAPQLDKLASAFLPDVQKMTTGVAGAFNQMFMGATNQLMTPGSMASIKDIINNIVTAFQNLTPAMAPLTKAFADISAAGSSFLPQFATAAADAATKFSTFITNASQSGQLKTWIGDGVDILKQVGAIVWDVGRAFVALAPVAKDVLPYISNLAHDIADILGQHPGLIWAVVGAFSAWKAIQGVAALSTALTSINKMLGTTLPASATTAAGKMTAALGPVAALLAGIYAATDGHPEDYLKPGGKKSMPTRAQQGDWGGILFGRAWDWINGRDGKSPDYTGGGGNFGGDAPAQGPGNPQPQPGNHHNFYKDWYAPTVDPYPANGYAVPSAPPDGGKDNPAYVDPKRYQVDPSQFPPGPTTPQRATGPGQYVVDPQQVFDAQSSAQQAQNTLEQDRLALINLQDKGNASQAELLRAQNTVQEDERQYQSAQAKLVEAQQGSFKKQTEQANKFSQGFDQLSAGLDKDLGVSKGLAGMADNLVRFIGALATAPIQAQLQRQIDANPNEGSGLVGIAAAQGVFGPQYTPGYIAAQNGQPGGQPSYGGPAQGGDQPYGLPPGTNTGGYGSSGPAFPPWVHAIEQIFGVKASTYPGHQESDRNEPGYAANPQHLNRGIDWSGPIANMQQLATYAATLPEAEQVIFRNTQSGRDTESVAGQSRPGYFASDLPDHTNHVHTRQAFSLPAPGQAPGQAPQWSADWNSMSQREASGNWQANTGNGYYGGLQFTQPSWQAANGTQYAPRADQASPYQQALTAENLLKQQGPQAWPNTFAPGSAGPTPGPLGGPMPGGPLGSGMPQGLPLGGPSAPAPGYQPTQQPAAPQGWQPSGEGGGGGGGIIGSAATAAAGMFPGGGAAAQIMMQMIQRTIKFGGQVAGDLASGAMDFMSVSDPDGGPGASMKDSWIGRLTSSLASASPSLPGSAGKQDQGQQKQQQQGQQQGQQGQGQPGRPGVHIENMNVQGDRRDGQKMANDLSYASYAANMPR